MTDTVDIIMTQAKYTPVNQNAYYLPVNETACYTDHLSISSCINNENHWEPLNIA